MKIYNRQRRKWIELKEKTIINILGILSIALAIVFQHVLAYIISFIIIISLSIYDIIKKPTTLKIIFYICLFSSFFLLIYFHFWKQGDGSFAS